MGQKDRKLKDMLLVSRSILEKASAGRNVTLVQLRSVRAEKQALASRGIDHELGAACRERRKETEDREAAETRYIYPKGS